MARRIILPYNFTPRDYQAPVYNAMVNDGVRRAITVWPRRNGKDIVAINILTAMAHKKVGTYFYMAPYYKQVREIIWNGIDGSGKRFIDYIPKALIDRKQDQEMRIFLKNGSIIKLCGSDNIDSIVGTNPYGIIFTEFSLHKPEAWHYLRPVLAENGGWALFNGTPRGLNHYYQLYEAAKKDKRWFTQYITRDDTNIPTLEAIEEDRRSGMPESLIQQEYYCLWTASTEETLIPLDIIKPCTSTELAESAFIAQPRILGVDVAFAAKGDRSIIAKRHGRFLHPLQKFQGLNNMGLATKVANIINEWHPAVVFIDAGRGEGVISRLEQLGYEDIIIPVDFGGTPLSDLYANKRTEMWCKMRDWFLKENQRPLIPYDEKLFMDLSAPLFDLNDKNRLLLESKKLTKKRIKKSMDEGDAVALTFADDVMEEDFDEGVLLFEQMFPELVQKPHYDPLNFMNAR